jgi:prepilin-type N-terminal cleavage/methylation domain-containing protein
MFARSSKIRIGHRRPSFTLVELLVVIAIIAIMAGMVMFTLASAQQDALRTRTRGTIDKINQVILERWEGYRYRSVKLPITSEMLQRKLVSARAVATLRSMFLKDMMRMEMPDIYLDLAYYPTRHMGYDSSPGREYNVLRNYFGMGQIPEGRTVVDQPTAPPRPSWAEKYQSEECLYAIVAHSTSGGGSALEGFVASEIGDVDGDGFPEFIDAWGKPIAWIRWPAGYNSALNLSYKLSLPPTDAFDPLRTASEWDNPPLIPPRQQPWTLVPLIFSAGADGQFGIDHSDNIAFAFAISKSAFPGGTITPAVGQILDANEASDNVSNHDILLE